MHKRGRNLHIKGAAFSQIFILIVAIAAFSFVLGEVDRAQATGSAVPNAAGAASAAAAKTTTTATWTGLVGPNGAGAGWAVGDQTTYRMYGGQLQWLGKDGAWVNSGQSTIQGAVDKGFITDPQLTSGSAGSTTGSQSGLDWASDLVFGQVSSTGWAGVGAHLAQGIVWAGIAYLAGQMIGSMLGMDEGQTKALSSALAGAFMAGKVSAAAFSYGDWGATAIGQSQVTWAQGISAGVGLVVGVAIFLYMYKKEETETYEFECDVWQPPIGGKDCEKCNADPMRPCTEYRCKSLGQACQLLNKEKPGEEKCAWVNPKDVNSPTITPEGSVLSPTGLRYVEDTSVRPPALGVKIVRTAAANGCLQAFTPLVFGITTNEPAQCKLDYNHTAKFDNMQFYLGGTNSYSYNHTQAMKLPGPEIFNETTGESMAGVMFKNDGTSQLFVRCRDANGNENVDEYSVKFCADKSPDTTPPFIEATSILSGSPVRFNADKIYTEFYVNEPAQCKWSIMSKAYEDMENNMTCALFPGEINARLSYTCATNLTGIKNSEENKFYVRCKDKPNALESERNVMVQSYEYMLRGSQELNIVKVLPNETVSGSTEMVAVDLEVETDDGSDEGQALCEFSGTGANDSYISMFETNSFRHKQTLQLTSGDYTFYFMCTDLGGNSANASTSFSVYSDREPPRVARIYKEEGTGLKVVTNEDAECTYSLSSCNFVFAEGLKLVYTNPSIKTNSYAEWKANTVYYIKCRDMYGNEPNPNECSVIARPVDVARAAE
jgi:hypothetical protein